MAEWKVRLRKRCKKGHRNTENNNSVNGVGEIIAPLKSETGLAIKGPKNSKAPTAVQGCSKSCSSHNEFDLYRHQETWQTDISNSTQKRTEGVQTMG